MTSWFFCTSKLRTADTPVVRLRRYGQLRSPSRIAAMRYNNSIIQTIIRYVESWVCKTSLSGNNWLYKNIGKFWSWKGGGLIHTFDWMGEPSQPLLQRPLSLIILSIICKLFFIHWYHTNTHNIHKLVDIFWQVFFFFRAIASVQKFHELCPLVCHKSVGRSGGWGKGSRTHGPVGRSARPYNISQWQTHDFFDIATLVFLPSIPLVCEL